MKKILFIIPAYKHGGTNKSLENLLHYVNDKFDVYILSMSSIGPYKDIFKRYKLYSKVLILNSIFDDFQYIKNEFFVNMIKKTFIKLLYRIFHYFFGSKLLNIVYRFYACNLQKENFDTIVAMQEGDSTHFASHINNYKIAWVHCDYNEYRKKVKTSEYDIYMKFNNVICVSEYTKRTFISSFPSLEHKCHSIHNLIKHEFIFKLSLSSIENENHINSENFKILSVGRLSSVKQFNIIPEIAYRLKNMNLKFVWSIIGDGEEKANIMNLITKYNVEDVVKLLGEKINPYPYFRNSNLLVVTSLSEACPYVVLEAKQFNLPVITTNYGSSYELIDNQQNGVITSTDHLYENILDLIIDKSKYKSLKINLANDSYDDTEKINKIIKLLNKEKI